METAYVLMLSTFAASVVLGATTKSNWIAIGLPVLIPVVVIASGLKGPGLAEGLLFVAPFLAVGAAQYGAIALGGSALGRWLRASFPDRSLKKNVKDHKERPGE